MRKYSQEQIEFLEKNISGRSRVDLTKLFNTHFGTDYSKNCIISLIKRHKLYNGNDGRFKPGSIPHNLGKKGVGGWPPTHFKPGHITHNKRPLGSERITKDGYVEIKVAEPKKWRGKHLVIWESLHGALPRGYVVIFADGNNRNFATENLVKVSRSELLYLNRKQLIKSDTELTKTAINIAKVAVKMQERQKKLSHANR